MSRVEMGKVPVTLAGQAQRHMPRYLVGFVLLLLYQGAQLVFDFRLQAAVNAAQAGSRQVALELGISLVLLAVLAFGVRVMSRLVMFHAGRQVEYELRGALLHRLHRLGPRFHERMPAGEVMSRVTNDLTHVRLLLGFGALNSVNTVLALVSAMVFTVSVSLKLTLAALLPLPILLWVTRRFSTQLYSRQRENQEALGTLSDLVQTSITGVRVVRSFHLEEMERARFFERNDEYLKKSLSLARLRGSMGPIMQGITASGALIVFFYGGHLLLSGEIDSGGFLGFFRALARLTWPLMALGFLIGLVQRGRAAYARLAEIFRESPEIGEPEERRPVPAQLDLAVKDLSFSYGDREVLSRVSFELAEGQSLAIVGTTGAGKSTLCRLLSRLENVPRGSVFLGGTDVCDLSLGDLRTTVGYAQQTPFLFSTSARQNIALALDHEATQKDEAVLRRAAQEAQVLSELDALPQGMDTVVGERGVQLSGGQKQRVALASAFVLGPKILVLDDPLSAVDGKTEQGILEAIDKQRRERTLVLVTHRVAAACRCDQILVLEEGRVSARGTHQELLQVSPLYRALAHEQSQKEAASSRELGKESSESEISA